MGMMNRSNALLNRTFLRVWAASLASGVAVTAHDTAATWAMNLMSPSGLFISLMASAASLPAFLFTLPAGALADAVREHRILRFANLWLAACAGGLALLGWAGELNPLLLLSGVFLLGAGFAISAPAWASLVPKLVTNEQLPSAMTLGGVQLNISGIIGPAVAGILLTKLGAPSVFALNAAGFLLVFASIPVTPTTSAGPSQTLKSMPRSVAETFLYTWRTQTVRRLVLRNSIFSFFVAVVPALAPILILRELRLDASSLGLVFTSMGIGSVLTAFFVLPWLRTRFSTETLMLISQVSLAGIYFLMSMVHHCAYCVVVMALAGASWTLAASEMWVLVQRALPDTIRGRVSALMMVLSQGGTTIGTIVWGLAAALTGTRLSLLAAAFGFLAVIGAMLLSRKPTFMGAASQTALTKVRPGLTA